MKGGRQHRVPLSVEALAVLNKASKGDPEDFVFAGRKKRSLSNMALLMLLRRMDRANLTVHGFRSTFRDWAAERTNFRPKSLKRTRTRGRRQGRSCLPSGGFFRKTAQADG